MARFKSLELESGSLTSSKMIEMWLFESSFYWLLDCELEDVSLKIENDILHWLSGTMYWGNWKWGVWKDGDFKAGNWEGGIHFSGKFKGTWNRGVWKGGTFDGKDLTGKINR